MRFNLTEVLSYIKEVYTKVYGVQYKGLIEKRIDSGAYICYYKNSINDFFDKCMGIFDLKNENLKAYLKVVFDESETFVMTANNRNDENVGVMFLPIYEEIEGQIEHAVLHECGHMIDINDRSIVGFDLHGDYNYVNPSGYREYEIFNEILTDVFALEAADVLHKSGIYIAEDKESLISNTYDINTDRDIKKFVIPLLDNYREEVIYSKLTGDYSALFARIGKENFDKLNNIINQAQCLIDNGLFEGNNDLISDYFKLLDELESVYGKMNGYDLKVFGK